MSVAMAYITVIFVWTTTPLGVTWSSESISPTLAGFSRMTMAAILGWLLIRLLGGRISWKRAAVKKYLSADIGIFCAMYATYQGAGMVPSGLISVIYGLSPIFSALLGVWLLNERRLPLFQWVACGLAVLGLLIIFGNGVSLSGEMIVGASWLIVAAFLFSLSAALVKKSQHQNNFMEQAVGSLICSVPFYAFAWGGELAYSWAFEANEITKAAVDNAISDMSTKSIGAVLYLATMGSLVGFMCYFYVLSKMSPSKVALVTLITPVLALLLGNLVNDEVVSGETMLGTGIILCSLVLFNWGDRVVRFSGVDQSGILRSKWSKRKSVVEDGPEINSLRG